MKLSTEGPRKKIQHKSTEVLLETEELNEVQFDPRRDVPAKFWEEVEKDAQHSTIPELKSNVTLFILKLLKLSVIDKKVKNLLLSRNDFIQYTLASLPLIMNPEKYGVTPGHLKDTADLLQVVPELGPKARKNEKPGSDGYKWYIERPLEDLNDYIYWRSQSKQQQGSEEGDPEQYLISGLEGSVATMRLFPAERSELKRKLLEVITPTHLVDEAKKYLGEGRPANALQILAYTRLLFPENVEEYQALMAPYWAELKSRFLKDTPPFYGWENRALHATLLAAHEVSIDQEGEIVIQLRAPKLQSRKKLPERNVA